MQKAAEIVATANRYLGLISIFKSSKIPIKINGNSPVIRYNGTIFENIPSTLNDIIIAIPPKRGVGIECAAWTALTELSSWAMKWWLNLTISKLIKKLNMKAAKKISKTTYSHNQLRFDFNNKKFIFKLKLS